MKKPIFLLFTVFLLISIVASGCTNNKTEDTSIKYPREINMEEAQIFARALNNNYVKKTANFIVTPTQKTGEFQLMNGTVDWRELNSRVEVLKTSLTKPDITSITTILKEETVYENFVGLEQALKAQNYETAQWVQRPLLTETYKNDVISKFILQLSADTPENPLLVRQGGVRITGKETVDGKTIYAFEKSGNIKYFVNEDSEIVRLILKPTSFDTPVIISFSDYGKTEKVELPTQNSYVDIDDVFEIFAFNRPGF